MTLLHAAIFFDPPLDIAAQMIRICPHLTDSATDCLNRTPLHVAAGSKASASLIKLIARAYPAACVVDEEGKTPLHFVHVDDENDDAFTSNQEQPKHESNESIAALLSISLMQLPYAGGQ